MNWKDKFPKENIYFQTDKGILYNGEAIKISFYKYYKISMKLNKNRRIH